MPKWRDSTPRDFLAQRDSERKTVRLSAKRLFPGGTLILIVAFVVGFGIATLVSEVRINRYRLAVDSFATNAIVSQTALQARTGELLTQLTNLTSQNKQLDRELKRRPTPEEWERLQDLNQRLKDHNGQLLSAKAALDKRIRELETELEKARKIPSQNPDSGQISGDGSTGQEKTTPQPPLH